jgi:hypothetical protein
MSDTAFEDPLLPLTAEDITALFTRADGQFLFARWGRPIAPVVFGVEDATVSILKGAIEAVVALAGHKMAETDPELGANLMVFFIRDWSELSATPGLDRLLPDLPDLVARLEEADANQYRAFRFEPTARSRQPSSSWHGRPSRQDPGRDHRAEPGGADDPAVVGHGVSGHLAARRPVRGWPSAPETGDRGPDPRRL